MIHDDALITRTIINKYTGEVIVRQEWTAAEFKVHHTTAYEILKHDGCDMTLSVHSATVVIDTRGNLFAPPPFLLPAEIALPPEEREVFNAFQPNESLFVGVLSERVTLSPSLLNATLLMLELKGFLQRMPGNNYRRLK